MIYNSKETNESGYLRRTGVGILPSKRKIRYRRVILTVFLFIVIGVELVIISYGIMMKLGRNLNGGVWEVEVEGCENNEKEEMKIYAQEYLKGKDALFNIGLFAEHMRRSKKISEISIKRQFPESIMIKVKMKEPFAYLISGRGYLIDEEGNRIGELYKTEMIKGRNYPVVYIEEKELNEGLIRKAVRIIKEVGNYDHNYAYLKQVRYEGEEDVFYLELKEGILKVSRNGAEEELSKYYSYRSRLADIVKEDTLMDLRFSGQIVLR